MTSRRDGRTSIRGGYGVYFGRVINSTVYNALVNTGVGPAVAQRQVTLQASSGGPAYPNLLTGGGTLVPSAVQYFVGNFQLPRIQQLDAIFEREIARNTVISALVPVRVWQSLPNFVDTNLPAPIAYVNLSVSGGPFDGQIYRTPLFVGGNATDRIHDGQTKSNLRGNH